MGNKTPTTDRASYSGGGGRGGANEEAHKKRQKKLQTNINKLKAKGATPEAVAGLKAKKEREAKKFEFKTTGVEEGIAFVKQELGLVEKKAGPMPYLQKGATTGIYAGKLHGTKGGMDFYGEEASAATDKYLKESGVPRYSKLWQELKYGISGSAMGSGDPSGIMTSVPISEAMFESQKKIQTLSLAGMSMVMPMVLGQGMRAYAADTYQRPYSDYMSTFYKGQSGEANFAKAKGFANQGQDTANLAMGDTTIPSGGEKKSTKFTKQTTKYFAASYSDQSKKKRKMFARV